MVLLPWTISHGWRNHCLETVLLWKTMLSNLLFPYFSTLSPKPSIIFYFSGFVLWLLFVCFCLVHYKLLCHEIKVGSIGQDELCSFIVSMSCMSPGNDLPPLNLWSLSRPQTWFSSWVFAIYAYLLDIFTWCCNEGFQGGQDNTGYIIHIIIYDSHQESNTKKL